MFPNIKAYQGHMSGPMKKFRWLDQYKLEPYHNYSDPLIVFGCYRPVDIRVVNRHKGPVIVFWCGNDTHKSDAQLMDKPNIIHTTILPKAQQYIQQKGIKCHLLKPAVKESREMAPPLKMGNKIYTYLNRSKPDYHGRKIIEQLNTKYDILVGDHSIPRGDWYNGVSNEYYSKCFIGLFLSDYVGGGQSVIEMGMRGIRVVTNVLNMPHTIPWETIEDVEIAIEKESENIGKVNYTLSDQVYDSLVRDLDCFDLAKLLMYEKAA